MKTATIRMMTLALAATAIFAFAGLAQARGMGGGYGHGGGHGYGQGYNAPALTADQQAKAQKIFATHTAAVQPIQQQMIVKQAELQAQMISATPDSSKIEALSKEIGALRGKMLSERANLNAQLTKEGLPAGGGYGMGQGMGRGGMGRGGMGHGGMGHGMGGGRWQ